MEIQSFTIDLGYAGCGSVPAIVFADQLYPTSGYHGVGSPSGKANALVMVG